MLPGAATSGLTHFQAPSLHVFNGRQRGGENGGWGGVGMGEFQN